MKERAYAELVKHFDSSSAVIKATINVLRAQVGRKMAKEWKTKSGQVTDEKYVSKWMFYGQLQFLRPVMTTKKAGTVLVLKTTILFHFRWMKLFWKKKTLKNYHCREKIRAVNKVCGIHDTRFVCQTTYSLCSTGRGKTGQV